MTPKTRVFYGALMVSAFLIAACGGNGKGGFIPSSRDVKEQIRQNAANQSFEQLVQQSSPTQYFELEETGCCTASNIGSSGANGTYSSSNITYSLSGPLQGETSTAVGVPGFTGTTNVNMGVSLPNPSTSGAFTIEDWVYPIFTPTHTTSNAYYTIWGYDGVHRLLISNQSTAQGQLLTQFGSVNFRSTKNLSANTWNQVVFVYDGSKEYFYINGALDSSLAQSGVALSAVYFLGQYNLGSAYKLDGRIAQHMVFPSALSAAVIQSHYTAATTAGATPTPSPTPTPPATQNFEQLVLQSNPAQYFELEEPGCCTASNSGSSGVNGTYSTSNITYSVAGPLQGETSTGIGLPGYTGTTNINMGVSVPNPSTSGAFTVEDWVYPVFTPTHNTQNAYYTIWGYDGTHRLLISNQSTAQGQLFTQFGGVGFRSTKKLAASTWNQVVFVYDGSKEYFYINGALDSSLTQSGVALSAAYFVGQFNLGAGYKLDGRIGQHMVFQSALSAAVIQSHYTGATSGGATSQKVDWPTWGMSPYRNAYNASETTLSTSNVAGLHEVWPNGGTSVGGVITDEPIIAANVSGTSAGTIDLLFVGDAHANFYAMNANTGDVLWKKTLQSQVIDGHASATADCFDQPGGFYGIGGSPTVDRSSSLVYVVDALGNLDAFDLASGAQKAGPAPMWSPPPNGVNITNDYGGLNEDSRAGVIYVPSNAHCGLPNYGGMQRYTISSGAVAHFFTEGGPPNTQGGVWGPGGAVIDPRNATNPAMNDIFFGTAYGALSSPPPAPPKYPYSVVRLSESLGVVAANNPVTTTCCPDLDFGDTPLVFTPSSSGCGRTLVVAESKNSKLYVYDADNINSGPLQMIQFGTLSTDGNNLGTGVYDPTRNLVFIQNGSDSSDSSTGIKHGLVAFSVTSACQLQLAWQQTVGPNQTPDGPPEPPTVANGVVYYVDGPGTGCTAVANPGCISGTSDFYAFNASNGQMLLHTTLAGPLFTPPVVVNGHVYLTSWNGQGPGVVYCFGL